MATTATNLDNIKVNYPSMLDKFDNRTGDYGLLAKANEYSNSSMGIVTNDLKTKAMNSWGRTIDIPVMAPTAGGLASGLVCTPTDDVAISSFTNVTWVSVSASWFMEPSLNEQNEISYLEMWLNQYRANMNAIYNSVDSSIDTALIAALAVEAEYSSSYIGVGNKYGALTADRIDVSLAQRTGFLNDMTSINKADDIFGRQDIIGSTNAESIVRDMGAQGSGNDTNEGYQLGLFDFSFTNNVTVGAASDASCYVVPKGAFGIVYRNHPDCAAGRSTTSGKQYSTMYDPVFGANIDVTFQSVCADINAKTGNALDVANVQELHQVNVNFGIITPSNSFGVGASVAPGGVIRGFNFQTA
jgi:hypothetical protein